MLNITIKVPLGSVKKHSTIDTTVFIMTVIWLWLFTVNPQANLLPEECGKGRKILLYSTAPSIDLIISRSFSDDLFDALSAPLKDIGYCPVLYDPLLHNDSLYSEIPLLYVDVQNDGRPIDSGNIPVLVVSLLSVSDLKVSRTMRATDDHPLISLSVDRNELTTFVSVVVRKITENLRTQYVCHLRLESEPTGVFIKANNGLEGITPLEWVIPVGNLKIEGEFGKYMPLKRTLNLRDPGIHTYVLEMRQRQFYSSKFMYPTVLFGLSSAALFSIERYYYTRYLNLGKDEYYGNPEKFDKWFNTAKKFEYAAFSTLALTGVSFTMCFIF